MHTPGESCTPNDAGVLKCLIMNKLMSLERGLTPLNEREMLQKGGMTLSDLQKLLRHVNEIIKILKKYWPTFKEGWTEGWRGAQL